MTHPSARGIAEFHRQCAPRSPPRRTPAARRLGSPRSSGRHLTAQACPACDARPHPARGREVPAVREEPFRPSPSSSRAPAGRFRLVTKNPDLAGHRRSAHKHPHPGTHAAESREKVPCATTVSDKGSAEVASAVAATAGTMRDRARIPEGTCRYRASCRAGCPARGNPRPSPRIRRGPYPQRGEAEERGGNAVAFGTPAVAVRVPHPRTSGVSPGPMDRGGRAVVRAMAG